MNWCDRITTIFPHELARNKEFIQRVDLGCSYACYCVLIRKDALEKLGHDGKAIYNGTDRPIDLPLCYVYTNEPAETFLVKRMPRPLLRYYYVMNIRRLCDFGTSWYLYYNMYDIEGNLLELDYDNAPDFSSIGVDRVE